MLQVLHLYPVVRSVSATLSTEYSTKQASNTFCLILSGKVPLLRKDDIILQGPKLTLQPQRVATA